MGRQIIKIPRNAGKIAKNRRKQLCMTQRELAQRSGVSERTIYSFELGEKPGMHLSNLLAVYNALGLSLEVVESGDPRATENDEPTKEQLIQDFLMQMKEDHLGGN